MMLLNQVRYIVYTKERGRLRRVCRESYVSQSIKRQGKITWRIKRFLFAVTCLGQSLTLQCYNYIRKSQGKIKVSFFKLTNTLKAAMLVRHAANQLPELQERQLSVVIRIQ